MKVLIVSESFIIRDSLNNFFHEEFNVNNIKSISNLDYLCKEEFLDYDFLFIDANTSRINIVEKLRLVKNKSKNIRIMILDNKKDIELFLKTLNYGVDGYILNIDDKDEFTYNFILSLYNQEEITFGNKFNLIILNEIKKEKNNLIMKLRLYLMEN